MDYIHEQRWVDYLHDSSSDDKPEPAHVPRTSEGYSRRDLERGKKNFMDCVSFSANST